MSPQRGTGKNCWNCGRSDRTHFPTPGKAATFGLLTLKRLLHLQPVNLGSEDNAPRPFDFRGGDEDGGAVTVLCQGEYRRGLGLLNLRSKLLCWDGAYPSSVCSFVTLAGEVSIYEASMPF